MRVAWFTPARNGAVAEYSRRVSAAMIRLCEPHLFCDGPADRFYPGVRIRDVAARPESLSDLASFDAVFFNLGNDFRQHAWIFDVARMHPGIVVLHEPTLHRFFLDYYLRHLGRPDLYITRMAEHYGMAGLMTAHRVLGPGLGADGVRIDDDELLRYTFTEEALRRAIGVVVDRRRTRALVERQWHGPVCEASLPAYPAADPSGVRDYARQLLRFAKQTHATGSERALRDGARAVADRIATHIGAAMESLGVPPGSPVVEAVIREASSLLAPPPK